MSKSKVTLQVVSSGILREEVLMLGEAIVKQLKIPVNQPLTLRFGSFKHRVSVVPIPRFDGLRMNHALARGMGLLTGHSLRIVYKPSIQTLCLGPLIGVLISRDRPETPDKPFGQITMFCKELVDACQSQGALVCFFTPEQIQDLHIDQAWVFANGSWKKTNTPVPDVINNRLTSRKLENKPSVQHFMKEVKSRYQSHIFNEKFLDKTEVFDALQHDAELARYLPESHLLRNFTMLKSMCSRYNTVFLKPARGSLGKGIVRITRMQDSGYYQAMYSTISGTKRQQYASLLKLFSSLSGKMKSNRYQIQQGLTLIDHGKRPVDFRALVQKNATGKWTITSIVARIASTQHFVSNLARGGSLSTVKEAVNKANLPSNVKNDVHVRLKKAALDIARGVDTHIPAHFGELGIDLAVDSSGRVWLLEVNSKPSKNDNTPLNDNKIRPSVRKIVEYARFLSGF
ncbi:YheC/YheD family endospore coat-associated protein [Paenibacillus apiarius]|uniref:YheC/YheD family protein n=1 Tax=Paenibacillus apiarius TaxID=46240 RepID=A0ABT4E153_9BACL|nr:YheC/YheD family protein [Paenibacillus apiarius]MCY9514918.1 YheC/YheD family protein [Paenibacillus apiarius]MCY9523334.1 YheC/YheD family protein [Paenibacillus apiarius]MCY9554162.1 YheC/YheD family protein [Paenibacillus apiarius]MCY9559428.1 YheC/YheD family protein [Paenibacillus apiarius]MCY9686791.1 YheC/YheD family protein [Paenibacillus apiarius]